ncbi:WD40 repeat-like protein, partial [Auriscalpium vulgare]
DKTIRIWDAHTGQPVGTPLEGHTEQVQSVAYSPDGQHIVSGSYDKTIRIWDAHTGQPVGTPFEGHTDFVQAVACSPDGQHIVSCSYDKTIRIWNAKTENSINLQSNQPSIQFSSHADHALIYPETFQRLHPGSPIQFRLQNDGWIVDLASSPPALLMWLPPQYQIKGLYTPYTCCVIGAHPIQLDLSDFAHGPRWAECMKQ